MAPAWTFRLRDGVVAGIALVVLSPLLLLIALSLKLTQPRVLFFQLRPGKNGKPFRLVKFSTLYDAPEGSHNTSGLEGGLTPVGKWLRKTSMDELPQLWNVLMGEMGLVGPRPLLMEYLPLYSEMQLRRHEVPPGITGWAQVKGRNQLTFNERFALDLWYIDHRSHGLDMRIIFMTFGQFFAPRGVMAGPDLTSEKFNGKN